MSLIGDYPIQFSVINLTSFLDCFHLSFEHFHPSHYTISGTIFWNEFVEVIEIFNSKKVNCGLQGFNYTCEIPEFSCRICEQFFYFLLTIVYKFVCLVLLPFNSLFFKELLLDNFFEANDLVQRKFSDCSVFYLFIEIVVQYERVHPITFHSFSIVDFQSSLIKKLTFGYEVNSINILSLFEDGTMFGMSPLFQKVEKLLQLYLGQRVIKGELFKKGNLFRYFPLRCSPHDI